MLLLLVSVVTMPGGHATELSVLSWCCTSSSPSRCASMSTGSISMAVDIPVLSEQTEMGRKVKVQGQRVTLGSGLWWLVWLRDDRLGPCFGSSIGFRPDGCRFRFIFAPTGWTRTTVLFFTRRCIRNLKRPEIWKKTQKLKFMNSLSYCETQKTPKGGAHLQNPTNPRRALETRWVWVSNFTRECRFECQIQPNYIFSQVWFSVDQTHCHP
jgi:hypothetical protein